MTGAKKVRTKTKWKSLHMSLEREQSMWKSNQEEWRIYLYRPLVLPSAFPFFNPFTGFHFSLTFKSNILVPILKAQHNSLPPGLPIFPCQALCRLLFPPCNQYSQLCPPLWLSSPFSTLPIISFSYQFSKGPTLSFVILWLRVYL